jgi:hypothetical protein
MWFLSKKNPAAEPDEPPQPRPLVDDAFWFERSKEMVQGAATKRTEAAGKLQTTIGWFWTIYAAAAVVGVSFSDKNFDLWTSLLIVLPVPFLVAGYWLAGWAQVPINVQFDPRAPDEIKAAHVASATKKRERLKWATILSAVGAGAVTIAILTASLIEPNTTKTAGFSASFDKNGERAAVVIGGAFPAGAKVVVTTTPRGGPAIRRAFITPASGELECTVTVPVAGSYEVTATWDEEKIGTRSLTKTVTGEKAAETM